MVTVNRWNRARAYSQPTSVFTRRDIEHIIALIGVNSWRQLRSVLGLAGDDDKNWRIASLVLYFTENKTEHSLEITFKTNKYLCIYRNIRCHRCNLYGETCRRWYERTGVCRCPVHQTPSYDTWTDCRPTSSRNCSMMTCKVLSSIHPLCYNTQQSNITDVYCRVKMSKPCSTWIKVGEKICS